MASFTKPEIPADSRGRGLIRRLPHRLDAAYNFSSFSKHQQQPRD
ncbi:hypothetical protein M8C21_031414 [Ambrosia artemisiifolia]|uniref:Uncharacterized protein n=1 Tax=Ambrosia artemisiifolia TaxID=4212 RepID=A0AAD5CBA6_AMBAR|nr:hypothetical protein M8C21_031414 [Ambrosia artemisiifolia]